MAVARKSRLDTTFKGMAGFLSAGAALVSILSFLATRKGASDPASAEGLAVVEASRVELSPSVDTAFALGDTLHFTSAAVDAHGQALRAAAVHWSVDDPTVAAVDSTGIVVARGAGTTGLTVALGGRVQRARVVVAPRPVAVALSDDVDTLRLGEGGTATLQASVRDARGHPVPGLTVRWDAGDLTVASVDSTGVVRAIAPGVTSIGASAAGLEQRRVMVVLPVAASITLLGGESQRTAAGARLTDRVAVQVVSRSGRPVPAALVRFVPVGMAGTSDPDSVLTDDKGFAAAYWSLGPRPGRQRLEVQVDGVQDPMVVTAEADPLPGATRIVQAPDSIVGEAGLSLPQAVAIVVTDTSGTVLADVPVSWATPDSGQLTQVDPRTDSLGRATAQWALGPRAGTQRLRVQVGNPRTLPPFTMTARVTPGPVTTLELVSGSAQRGTVGAALAKAVVFRATDSLGNPVEGVPVRLAASAGQVDSVVTTGANGQAKVAWTLGKEAGSARLEARLAEGPAPVEATAVARPAAAATLAFVSPATSGTTGKSLPKPVVVEVRDRYGNRVPGVTVRFGVTAGKASPTQAVTDSTGRASIRWTLGPAAGAQTLSAAVKQPALKASQRVTAKAPPPKKPSTRRKTAS